jgi:transcriptional regulator with XRE-family HTH domain
MRTAATDTRKVRTFGHGDLVADLMAELSRVQIAQRIATARKQAGLDQRELADVMRVHWRTVQDWESVKKQATPWDRLDELASVTGVTKDWLLHGERGEVVPDGELLARRLEALEAAVTESVALTRRALELLEADERAGEEHRARARGR